MKIIASAYLIGQLFQQAINRSLASAVVPDYRGRGIGTKLLMQILGTAKMKYSAVSLSVRANNPVVHLYERTGFMKISGSEVVNRAGEVSFNMVCELFR